MDLILDWAAKTIIICLAFGCFGYVVGAFLRELYRDWGWKVPGLIVAVVTIVLWASIRVTLRHLL